MRVSARKGAIVGAASLALILSACGGGDDEGDSGAAGGDNAITIDGCTPQNPLVPGNTNEVCGGDVLDAIFSKLVRYNPDTAEPENDIAESIESEDNTNWTITLKDGWTFHDGTPVTAQSFVDAWNWVAYGPNAALSSYFMEPIAGYADLNPADPDGEDGPQEAPVPATETMSGLAVVDDTTFTVTLSAPASSFPIRLGYTAFAPLPASFYDDPEAFGKEPVGSGPFQLDEYNQNVDFKLSAYPDFAGEVKPKVDSITVKIYQDQDAAYADLLANNLDVLTTLPTSALANRQFEQDLGERSIVQAAGVIQTMTFPPSATDPSYDNPKLRQAVSKSVNRQQIIDTIFDGTRTPASSWSSPVVGDFADEGTCGEFCDYDPEGAKALLAEAGGYAGTMTLSYNADGDHKGWTEAVCNSITNTLGVACQATPLVDFATFRTAITNREMKGMFRTGWQMDYPALENFLVPIFATGASSNDGDYSNPQVDDLFAQAASAEGDAATDLYLEAERVIAQDMPVVALWYPDYVHGFSENVTNVKITPFSTLDVLSIEKA